MLKRYIKFAVILSLLPAFAAAIPRIGAASSVVFSHEYSLENGTKIRVYPPGEILETMTRRDGAGRLVFNPPGGGEYILVESIDDPVIVNTGEGEFFPMEEEVVLDALRSIDVDGRMLDIEIDIYLLPLPRLSMLSSSTSAGRIFLSPGTRPWRDEVTAWTVAHEFGHCFQHVYLPMADADGWTAYLDLRGILDDPAFTESAVHMYRPSEVFAEDFRALFGGEASCYSGTIENPALTHPIEVAGLGDWIAGLVPRTVALSTEEGPAAVHAYNYPNPFNPSTTISATLGAEDRARSVDVRIYAADGSVVRRLFSGIVAGREFSVAWDGRRDGGGAAASGVYFYRIISEGSAFTGKMLLLR